MKGKEAGKMCPKLGPNAIHAGEAFQTITGHVPTLER